MKKSKAKNVALFAMMIALAFALSYLESLIPINIGVPGIKLGLANLVVLAALYIMPTWQAAVIAVIRILLAGLTFGNVYSLAYSFCGGLLSFLVMWAVKKSSLSIIGVSILGAVCHNIGQIAVAALIMHTYRIVYYFPVLLVSGAVTGMLVGIVSKAIVTRTDLKRQIE